MTSDDVQRFKPVGADGPEVVLASDFDAMRQRAEKAELRAEQLRAIARDLRRHATCENMGHGRLDFHGLGDPCKVLERIDAALAKQV